MKQLVKILFSALISIWLAAGVTSGWAQDSDPVISVLPAPKIDQGAAARVQVVGLPQDAEISGKFDGRKIFFFPASDGSLVGIFGADVMLEPGSYPLNISWSTGKKKKETGSRQVMLDVVYRDYGTRSLKVPDSQVDLSKEDLARAEEEKKATTAALDTQSPERLWQGQFLKPIDSSVISAFGRRTKINGVLNPRPHTGVDIKAATGTVVKAPADGIVLLAADHFFAGNSIYIDHGQGLITMYFHLSKMYVDTGEIVTKGQQIGEVGATGRVTGPHLHYGLYLNRARLDPFSFHRILELPPLASGAPESPVSKAN